MGGSIPIEIENRHLSLRGLYRGVVRHKRSAQSRGMRMSAASSVKDDPVGMMSLTAATDLVPFLEAGKVWMAEVPAAGLLQQATAKRGRPANLWRG
ncbi:MAG: hypothetical protein AAF702_49465 [Chloroflexota bacterium]